mmetsp:Transcript_21299/g.32800  ORF Transcript_21299/g.32800 Transcript_21299/m.32800 type:complete len:108 (-) Transcript_21299:563-886(-)
MGHFAQVHLAQFFNLDCALFKTATAFTYNYFGCSYCAMAKSKKSSSSCTVCKKRFWQAAFSCSFKKSRSLSKRLLKYSITLAKYSPECKSTHSKQVKSSRTVFGKTF